MENAIAAMNSAIASDNLANMISVRDRYYNSDYFRGTNRASFWESMNALRNAITAKMASDDAMAKQKAENDALIAANKAETERLISQILAPSTKATTTATTKKPITPLIFVIPAIGYVAYKFFNPKRPQKKGRKQ